MEMINYIIEEGLILIPVLFIIGEMIRTSETINNKWIPLIILGFSLVITPYFIGEFNAENLVQAILIAGVTVYSDQVVKQFKK